MSIQELLYATPTSNEVDLPSGGKATVREMTGHDQRAFINKAKLMSGVAVQELLANCTLSVKDSPLPEDKPERIKFIQNMLSGDRATLLFSIRIFSLGNDFTFTGECPSCKERGQWEVDLSDKHSFPITHYPAGEQRIMEYESKVRPGLKFQYTQMDGTAEMSMLRKRSTADLLTDLELRNPKVWDGKTYVAVRLNDIQNSLIDEMRAVIRQGEGQIDSTVKIACQKCGEESQFDLLQVPDFMTPNVIS